MQYWHGRCNAQYKIKQSKDHYHMDNLINSLANNSLERLINAAPHKIVGAIKDAASETGVDFAYLLQQAKAESSFDAGAKAKTSSASGLFQFIESTWMNMIDKYGDKYGIDKSAGKKEILNLRNNPDIASKMAAEFAGENKAYLDKKWAKGEHEVGSTELYFAHFMGAGGAASFLNARDENPGAKAAVLFPKAAAANKNVFYDRATGRAKTLDEVYAFFDKKFQIEGDEQPAAITQLAEATPLSSQASSSSSRTHVRDLPPPHEISPAYQLFERTAAKSNALIPSSYQSLFANPVDLMLLAQLDLPVMGSQSKNGTWAKQSIF